MKPRTTEPEPHDPPASATASRRAARRDRTTFVGRSAEIAEIRRLVEDGAALVTLVGPPGIGKTRLSVQAARALGGDVTFCDVSEARDLSALLTAAAIALGISIESPMSDEALARWIGRAIDHRGDAVILLDNAEQVVADMASVVSLWLDLAPGAVFLVTSRERLRIPGEHVLEVGPLGLPKEREDSVEALLDAEAVRLLLDRAARASHRGTLFGAISSAKEGQTISGDRSTAHEEAMVLAEIVRRVEGVPLAIELCAARLGMLEPAQLLARLSRRIDVLASDLRYAPRRQANLRGAIDWSWDLLDDRERSAFAQTSVFRGGFDLEAAEAVLDPGAPEEPAAVLDVLSALRDKSMITIAEGLSAGRYRLYESLREYAAEKLAASPDGGRGAVDRHLRYFAEAGARWAEKAKGAAFQEGLAALSRESDNLLAAADRARERGDFDRAALVTICLEPLAIVRGPVMPYLDRLDRLVAEAGDRLSPRAAARALGSLGVAESRRGKPAASIARFTRAIEIAAARRDFEILPFLLAKLGNQRMVVGDDAAAERAFERARELLDAREDPAVRGVYFRHHAFFQWRRGRSEEARREGEQARALLQAHGDRRELAYVLCDLAASSLDSGDLDATIEILEEALTLLRQLQYRRVESRCLLLFALARREQGRFDEAETDLRRALALPVEDGDRVAEGFALWHLACLALERGEPRQAHDRAREAIARYEEMGDKHLLAHARMILGAALAGLGDVESASAELAIADALREGGPAHLGDALSLFRAHVLIARASALAAPAEGQGSRTADLRSAEALRAEALAVLRGFDERSASLPLANERFARRLLEKALGAVAPPARERSPEPSPRDPRPGVRVEADLVVSDDGRWFRLSERREVNLERRAALRRILAALAKQRVTAPGTALPLDAVLEAGWPGERVSFEAGAARVYNAIQRLRKLGLESVLRTRDDGYLLDAGTSTRIA